MKNYLTVSALATVVLFAAASEANAFSRSGSRTGPRGTATFNGSTNCAGGACTSQGTRTGPLGRTATRQSSGSCSGGSCTRNGQVTGPGGRSINRTGTITR